MLKIEHSFANYTLSEKLKLIGSIPLENNVRNPTSIIDMSTSSVEGHRGNILGLLGDIGVTNIYPVQILNNFNSYMEYNGETNLLLPKEEKTNVFQGITIPTML